MSSNTDTNPMDVPKETADEKILHRLAQLRADSTRLNRLTSDHDVPPEVSAQLGFMSADIDTLTRDVADYICGSDPLPDVCPVCGESIDQPEREFEAGESYAADRMCVVETSSIGVSQSIIHYSSEPQGETDE